MEKTGEQLKSAQVYRFIAVFLLCAAAALYAVATVLAGGSAAGLVLYPLAFLLAVLLPGLHLCELLLPKAAAAERWVIALPAGALLLVLNFSLLGWLRPGWAGLCAGPSVVVGLSWLLGKGIRRLTGLAAPGKKIRARVKAVSAPGWGLALLLAAGLFISVWLGVFAFARVENAGNMVYSQDMLWSAGNAGAVNYGMPMRDLRAAGGVLHYHYLADALCGLVASLAGQSAWDAACFYNWPLFFAGLCGGLYLAARRLGARGWAALVAPFGALFAHFAWDASAKHIFQNVNGVLQSYQFLAAALLVLLVCGQEGQKQTAQRAGTPGGENPSSFTPFTPLTLRGLVAFCLCAAALLWSKSTVGLLFVCAVLAAGVAKSVAARRVDKWTLAAGAAGAAIFGLLYLLVYRHAINNLVLRPTGESFYDAFRILATMYLPGLVLYLAAAVCALRAFQALSAPALAVHALVAGGVLAYILFYHYSFSQSYFLLAAAFAMWLCVAAAAPRLFARKALRAAAAGLCALGLAVSLYYAAPALRRGAQVALRCAGLRPSLAAEAETVTPADGGAAAFLRDNMGPGDVFATNRNAKNPDAAEGVFHYYTAASGRQAFVESWRYAMDYSMEYTLLRHNLEQVSDAIFAQENWQSAQGLAAQNGIDYLLVHLPSGGRAFNGGQPVFAAEGVVVYRVNT